VARGSEEQYGKKSQDSGCFTLCEEWRVTYSYLVITLSQLVDTAKYIEYSVQNGQYLKSFNSTIKSVPI
jgi:hypothetical protein